MTIDPRIAYIWWTRGGLSGFADRNHDIDDVQREALSNAETLAGFYEHRFVSATFRNLDPVERETLTSRKSVTVSEAAARLGVSPQAIRKAIKHGSLPAEKRGRSWEVSVTDLAYYQARRAAL